MGKGKKKNEDKVIVTFVSNSSMDVTGSGVKISYKNRDYLLEYGLLQENGSVEKEYVVNYQYAQNLNIDNLKCILVSHQNIDHIGLIPSLVKRGFRGDIIGTYESLEFSKKLLYDSAFIINRNVEYLKSKGKKVENLYKEQDVTQTTYQMRAYDLGVTYEFDEYMSFQLLPTNHLCGSCQIIVWIKKDNGQKIKIGYTGDLGNNVSARHKKFLRDTEIIHNGNLLISECTYFSDLIGYNEKNALEERKDMKQTILDTLHNNGKVVSCTFSMGRSQDLMIELYNMFKDDSNFHYSVVVDSRLTGEINRTYSKVLTGEDKALWETVLKWKNFKFITDFGGTKAAMSKREPMVVLSSNGMCTNGHSVEWVKTCIDCSKDTVMIVGYVPEGTLLDKLYKREQKTVTVDKRTYLIRCSVKKYKTFSSHISSMDLLKLLKQTNFNNIIFHHGSSTAKENAVKYTKEELMNIGNTCKVMASYKGMEIKL